jgi:hypothetical protein
MTRTLKISLPSDEEIRQAVAHAPGGCAGEATNPLQMVVTPIRRVERIKRLYTVGENIRRIARAEVKNQAAVQRIVRGYAAQQYIEEVRMQLYGLLGPALESIRYSLDSEKGDKLAYQLLADLGALQKRI